MTHIKPQHVAFIMDGNRRWAREQGMLPSIGHKHGYDRGVEIVRLLQARGIHHYTFYAFSSENWKRAKEEVSFLMDLMIRFAQKSVSELHAEGIRFVVSGRLSEVPEKVREALQDGMDLTKDNTKGVLNIAFNYGGRPEIVDAVKSLIKQGISGDDVTEEIVAHELYNADIMPDPDLVIRTGGEQRLSNFLLWQLAYAELYFTDVYWPAFSEQDLDEALEDFSQRKRNYGK